MSNYHDALRHWQSRSHEIVAHLADKSLEFQDQDVKSYLEKLALKNKGDQQLIIRGKDEFALPHFENPNYSPYLFNYLSSVHNNLAITSAPTQLLGNTLDDFYEMIYNNAFSRIMVIYAFLPGKINEFSPDYFLQPIYHNQRYTVKFSPTLPNSLSKQFNLYEFSIEDNNGKNHVGQLMHLHQVVDGEAIKNLSFEDLHEILNWHDNLTSNKTILHCLAGIGRSATIAFAWRIYQCAARIAKQTEIEKVVDILYQELTQLRSQRNGAVCMREQVACAIVYGISMALTRAP